MLKIDPTTTFHPLKHKNIVTSPHQLSAPGLNPAKLNTSDHLAVSASTIYPISNPYQVIPTTIQFPTKPFVTPEYPHLNNAMIYIVKPNFSLKTSQTPPSSPISDRNLIITDAGFNSSLLKYHQTLSKLLPLPIETDFVDMVLNSSIGSSDNIMSNSWFLCKKKMKTTAMNSLAISSTSATILQPNIMVEKPPNTEILEKILRTRKIRVNPTKPLRLKIKQAIAVTRYLYNKCVELCCKSDIPQKVNLQNLRWLLIDSGSSNILPSNVKSYFEQVPYDIRNGALDDFVKAYRTQMDLVKQGKKVKFEMKYRRKKNLTQESFVINHKHLKSRNKEGKLYCFAQKWRKEYFNTFREPIPTRINNDCRLIVTMDNKYYLSIPRDVTGERIENSQKPLKYNAVSLDPGVRTFQTTYDTEGASYKIGDGDDKKLDQLGKIATRMREGMKRIWENGKKVYRKAKNRRERKGLLKAANKIETKIRNKVNDIQRKTAKFLCEKYDTVIIPEFRSQNMAEKRTKEPQSGQPKASGKWKRKINKETTRKMIRWSHYKFREILRAKGELRCTNVVVGTEEWTSKTCGNCMWVNMDLGGNKVLSCKNCKIRVDRDIGAARNIMMLNWGKSGLKIKGVPATQTKF